MVDLCGYENLLEVITDADGHTVSGLTYYYYLLLLYKLIIEAVIIIYCYY